MSEIKLVCFDVKARGEPIRLVLEAAGKKYEDVRVPVDQWPAEKPNTPYGQLPYVIYNGKKYGQSVALAAFFAREYGLYGKTNLDALRIDEVVGLCKDFGDALGKVMFERDETKKAEMGQKLVEETAPQMMSYFQKLLEDNGSCGYFVGKTITLADLMLYNLLDFAVAEKESIRSLFPPEVTKLRGLVEAHPLLKTYLAKRT